MRSAIILAFTILFTLPQTSGAAGTYSFPRPADMEHQIRFWKNIFTLYSQDQIVVHDTADLDRVYTVLDFRSYAAAGMTEPEIEPYKKAGAEAEEARLKDLFMRLQAGTPRASSASAPALL